MVNTFELGIEDLSQLCSSRLEKLFKPYLQNVTSIDLRNAMEYTYLSGGKRLRPLLVYATGSIFNAPFECLDLPATAVELIHTYSLIHDDLPCMDDADLRRGKPSCHKVFGDAIAVLTGDALQTLALQILATHPSPLKAERRLQMMTVLTEACGPFGMVDGQALDITVMNDDVIQSDLLEQIYHLKTGELITASIELGRLASKDNDDFNRKALFEFGTKIGLAFQIQDDILDVEAVTEHLGKQVGIDELNNKLTYVKIHGIEKAKDKVESLFEDALQCINYLGNRAQLLRELSANILKRDY